MAKRSAISSGLVSCSISHALFSQSLTGRLGENAFHFIEDWAVGAGLEVHLIAAYGAAQQSSLGELLQFALHRSHAAAAAETYDLPLCCGQTTE